EFVFQAKPKRDMFTFVSVGSLNYNKGFDVLINAFKKANFSQNVYLKIIGKGEEYNNLQKQINQLGLNNQVQLLGFMTRSKISGVMQESDVFVLASRSETF